MLRLIFIIFKYNDKGQNYYIRKQKKHIENAI